MPTQKCARCGRTDQPMQTVYNTLLPRETIQLCASCVRIVIRPTTAWQVKQEKGCSTR
ncbi:MAG TPA: hypothetical protein VFQ36_24285 [Ktedonobacteraceae bacterium]|nr:hypothetical protein [Ktedonobacteraceae bacterium]